jgi:hypothetical protein
MWVVLVMQPFANGGELPFTAGTDFWNRVMTVRM